MRYEKSDLCQLGWLSCMGCCGNNFKEKLEVAKAIEKNTKSHERHVRSTKPLIEWMNRSKDLRKAGICKNLVYDVEKDIVHCPLHPEVYGLLNGKDARLEHHTCDILHVCKTAFFFNLWESRRQKEFLDFIKKKKKAGELDWYSYSMKMADDSLLQEFEGLNW